MRIIKKGDRYYPQIDQEGVPQQIYKTKSGNFELWLSFFPQYGYRTQTQALKILKEYALQNTMTVIVDFKNVKELETYLKENNIV